MQCHTDSEEPQDAKIILALLPNADELSDSRREFLIEQRRIISTGLFSASALDQARVLSPLLANAHLRRVWQTGKYLCT